MKRVFHLISVALVLSVGSSCIAAPPKGQVSIDLLKNLPRGITMDDSQRRLETKLAHEFSEQRGTNRYDCMGFGSIEPPGSFYFLFANSNLVRIVIPPPFTWTNTPGFQRLLPVDPDQRITATMQQPDLSPSDIESELLLNSQKKGRSRTGLDNATPAFILTAPIWIALAPKVAAEIKQVEAWKVHYDPLLIPLGASISEVEKIFGKSAATMKGREGEIIRLYGHKNPPNVPAGVTPAVVGIVFSDERVNRILRDHFFPTTWLPLLP
jgi:hypothetical protein